LLLSQTCSAPSRDGSATSKLAQCEAPPAADPDRCTSAWLGAAVPVPGKPPTMAQFSQKSAFLPKVFIVHPIPEWFLLL